MPQRDLYDAFEDGDPRREYTIYSPGHDYAIYNGTEDFTYTHQKYNEQGEEISWEVTYKPGDMVEYDHRWSPTGLNVKKMTRSIMDIANARWSGLDVPVLRMAEVYLVLAEALAEQGDISSQLKMAMLYTAGQGVKKDNATAVKFYNQAAEQGSAEAMLQLGLIHMSGQLDVKRDPDKARELYLKAANQGYAKAQYYYGVSYVRGEGVPTDYIQGHAWMNVALENGYEPARNYIATLEETLSEAELEKSKVISDKLLAEIK